MKTKKTPIYLYSNPYLQKAELTGLRNLSVYNKFPEYDDSLADAPKKIGETISMEQRDDGIYAEMIISDPYYISELFQPCVGIEFDEGKNIYELTEVVLLPNGSNRDSNILPIEFIEEEG